MQMESRLIFPQTQHCLTKNNQNTKTACSASKNRKLKREREKKTLQESWSIRPF